MGADTNEFRSNPNVDKSRFSVSQNTKIVQLDADTIQVLIDEPITEITNIRGYPGAGHPYNSDIITYKRKSSDSENFIKINCITQVRSDYISPSKMKTKKERVEAAQANLEQLILAGIKRALKENPEKTDFVVDLQTLTAPPLSSADNEMDLDRLQAIDNLRKDFKKIHDKNRKGDPLPKSMVRNGFELFLLKNEIIPPVSHTGAGATIELITSNYPVNKLRAVSNFLAPLKVIPGLSHILSLPELVNNLRNNDPLIEKIKSTGKWLFSFAVEGYRGIKRARENNNTLKVLHDYLEFMTPPATMAKDALEKINAISGPVQRTRNFFKLGINHNAERAALEQIAASELGVIRIGSCMSGKDREGAVTLHVAAMAAFYAKYGQFPPIPPNSMMIINKDFNKKFPGATQESLREEYEEKVATHFLSGHPQEIAKQNAQGANGLKSSGDVHATISKKLAAVSGAFNVKTPQLADKPEPKPSILHQANTPKSVKPKKNGVQFASEAEELGYDPDGKVTINKKSTKS